MIEKIKWAGWVIVLCLSLVLLAQRCQLKNNVKGSSAIHDTVVVHGDRKLYIVQDTVLKPYKVYYNYHLPNVDTEKIIKDYFAGRVYRDTIKARDITAVIEDSVSANKIESHKALFENGRDLHLTTLEPKPVNKLFLGGFIGYSLKNMMPETGVSLSFITKKDVQYCYDYDVINRTHRIGLLWKIHFSKF